MFGRRKPAPAESGPARPVGPLFTATCAVDAGDRLRVRSQQKGERPYVTVGVQTSSDFSFVVMTPQTARRVAAAILNAADTVDGLKPLFPSLDPKDV